MKSRSCILLTSCAKFHIPFQETSGEAFADHAFCPLLHHGDGGQRTRRRDSTDTTSVIHILRRLRIQCREQPTLNYRTPGWRNLPYCLHCCMLLDLFFWLLGQCKCWSLETFVGLLVLFMVGLSLQASSHQIHGEGSARTVVNAMRVNVPIT